MLFALPGLLQTCSYTLKNNKVLNVLRGCLYIIPDFMVTYTWYSVSPQSSCCCVFWGTTLTINILTLVSAYMTAALTVQSGTIQATLPKSTQWRSIEITLQDKLSYILLI